MPTRFAVILVVCFSAMLTIAARAEAAEHVKLVVDYGDGVQKHFTALPWKKGLTVLGATRAAEKHPRGIETKLRGSGETAFLMQIDDVTNEGGAGRNWVYRVNGKLGDRSAGIYPLDAGDTVLWRFQKYE